MLVSQGQVKDQIVVKLNKDLFLMPKRFEDVNTVKGEDNDPYFIVDAQLPLLVSSEAELQVITNLTDKSTAAIVATIAIPFILGVLLKGVLSKLWNMIGTF